MKLAEVTDDELIRLRASYKLEVRRETQASCDVRRQWKIVIAALDEVLKRRNGGRLPVVKVDASHKEVLS